MPANSRRDHSPPPYGATHFLSASISTSASDIVPAPRPTQTTQRYKYGKLKAEMGKAFRLFKLHPASTFDADLQGEILVRRLAVVQSQSHGPLREAEPYEALSYCWGPFDPNTKPLRIVSQDSTTHLFLYPNLAAALRRLRLKEDVRYLWVDALCINQEDIGEKNRQISYISAIYNNAEHVRVWLGPGDDISKMAMEFIKRAHNLNVFEEMVKDSDRSREWDALSSLMRKSWFNRRWIIQEIATAKHATLICGKDEIEWREFVDVVSQLSYKQDELRELFRRDPHLHNPTNHLGDLSDLGAIRLVNTSDDLVHKSRDGRMIGLNFSLEALISSMSAFKASNAHDTVYAILWLANDAHPLPLSGQGISAPSTPEISRAASPTISSVEYEGTPPAAGEVDYMLSLPDDEHRYVRSASPLPVVDTPMADRGLNPLGIIPTIQEPRSSGLMPMLQRRARTLNDLTDQPEHGLPNEKNPYLTKLSVFWALGSRRNSIKNIQDPVAKQERAFRMLQEGIRQGRFEVSYDKPIFDVCKDLLTFIIKRSKSLDILCRPWAPDAETPMPSWVCSLSTRGPFSSTTHSSNHSNHNHSIQRRRRADPLLGKVEPGGPPYRASSSIPAEWEWPLKTPRILQAVGFRIASEPVQSQHILEAARGGAIPVDWRFAAGWKDPVHDSPPDCFWRTLVANRNGFGRRPPSYWAQACQHAFSDWHDGDLETKEVLQQGRVSAAVREYIERVQCVVWLRKMVLVPQTDQPEPVLALAPLEIKAGDIIVVLYGLSVPVVLRPHLVPYADEGLNGTRANGKGVNGAAGKPKFEYELIGECYVDGMMDGEAHGIRSRSKSKDDDLRERFDLR